jgi:hypothetical protein
VTPSPAFLARVRDYAVEQPSFTVPFAAWELGCSAEYVRQAIQPLLKHGVIEVVEPREGRFPAVYAYVPPPADASYRRRWAGPEEIKADLAPRRGSPVPRTGGAIGPSGKPGTDRKKQALGHRVKRQRQGT